MRVATLSADSMRAIGIVRKWSTRYWDHPELSGILSRIAAEIESNSLVDARSSAGTVAAPRALDPVVTGVPTGSGALGVCSSFEPVFSCAGEGFNTCSKCAWFSNRS